MGLLGTEKLPGEPLPPRSLLCSRHRRDGSLLAYVTSGRRGVTEQLVRGAAWSFVSYVVLLIIGQKVPPRGH